MTGTTADVVDHAKILTENKEKERSKQVAKQTIRITKPVTSELLQEKLLNLKNVAGYKSSIVSLVLDVFLFLLRNHSFSTFAKFLTP